MNDYENQESRKKNQTLVVVEGQHEKNVFLELLLNCFPQVAFSRENIHVYAADIYDLYHDIEKEYDEDWFKSDLEIDIPMLISRRLNIEPQLDKRKFTNIILIFDYEHHDTSYKDEKIVHMQRHFCSMTDDGILFINYPMVESYKHIISLPDEEYLERSVSVKCQPGREYKRMVDADSVVNIFFSTYEKVSRYLKEKINGADQIEIEKILFDIFSIDQRELVTEKISELLIEYVAEDKIRNNIAHSISAKLSDFSYFEENVCFWEKFRQVFSYIVGMNIEKAFGLYNSDMNGKINLKEKYIEINWTKVLEVQNNASKDKNSGYIWVLNTATTVLAEYKLYWNMIEKSGYFNN